MTEEAGYLQDQDLIEECAKALLAAHDHTTNDGREGGFYTMAEDWQQVYRDMAKSAIAVLRRRQCLSDIGLEQIKLSEERMK